nr:hypothetical protein F2B49_00415 [Candidatus Phytoplasma sacchari]
MNKKTKLLENFKIIIKNKRLSHLYLFESNKSDELQFSFIFDLVYEFLKDDYDLPNLRYLIENFSYPNFYYLSSNKELFIKKEQILDMKQYFNQTSLIKSKKVYLINKAENLSYEAANSLLYFFENPANKNILGILLTGNHNLVLSTIISRTHFFYLDFFLTENNLEFLEYFLSKKNKDKLDNVLIRLFQKFRKIKNEEIQKKNYYNNFKKFFLKFIDNFHTKNSFISLFLEIDHLLEENNFISDFLFIITSFFIDLYYKRMKINNVFPVELLDKIFFKKINLEDIISILNVFVEIEQKNYFLDTQTCFFDLLIEVDNKIDKIKKNFYFLKKEN